METQFELKPSTLGELKLPIVIQTVFEFYILFTDHKTTDLVINTWTKTEFISTYSCKIFFPTEYKIKTAKKIILSSGPNIKSEQKKKWVNFKFFVFTILFKVFNRPCFRHCFREITDSQGRMVKRCDWWRISLPWIKEPYKACWRVSFFMRTRKY